MQLKIHISSLIVLLAMLLPTPSRAEPLRIWVMHNDPSREMIDVTPELIRKSLRAWEDEHGIIIENDVGSLSLPTESEPSLASHIVAGSETLHELSEFRKGRKDKGKIAVEFLRWADAYNRITSALASSDASTIPDVLQVGSTWTASFADLGMLAEISDQFDESEFFPASSTSTRPVGMKGMYAVPWFVDTRLLFYNEDLIDSPAQLSTWEGFGRACRAFQAQNDGGFMAIPLTVDWNLLHNLAPWLWGAGGGVIEPTQLSSIGIHRIVLNGSRSMRAFKYLRSLSQSGCISFPDISQEAAERNFLEGKYAAIVAGPWLTHDMGRLPHHNFGVVLPPAGPNGSHPFVGGSHLAISAKSAERGNFDRAVELVRHFSRPKVQASYSRATGFLPANRKALRDHIGSDKSSSFRKALETGRSYPAIPEWGSIVENELTRDSIWHIWRDIAQVVTEETLGNTVDGVASKLRSKLRARLIERNARWIGVSLALAALLAAGTVLWWRYRYRRTLKAWEAKAAELRRVTAERSVLEGRTALLDRRGERQGKELSQLREELEKLERKSACLKAELEKTCVKKRSWDRKRIEPFSINWNGALTAGREPVSFENNRQARRLIEHMTRQACAGIGTVHCLWGYALFGWSATNLKTPPGRLFETVAAKINGRLKSLGYPPLIERIGRRSQTWRLFWDVSVVTDNSDIHRAHKEAEAASDCMTEGTVGSACAHAIAALELDPKCIDALAIIRSLLIKSRQDLSAHSSRMEALFRASETSLREDISSLESGIAEIEKMVRDDNLPRGIDEEEASDELRFMRHGLNLLRRRFAAIFSARPAGARPLMLEEIRGCIEAVREEISTLRSQGVSREEMWAEVAGSASFTRLLAVPHIQAMVNNFYNEDIQAKEDPRLVQLALISMLSRPDAVSKASDSKDERELLKLINRNLKKQLISLESELGTIS